MKKYVITSEHFTGQVDVWYNQENRLCYLNTLGAEGSTRIMTILLHQIPYHIKSGQLAKAGTINIFKIQEVTA